MAAGANNLEIRSPRPSLTSTLAKDFLQCVLCYDRYDDPRGLPCLHTFCSKCIKKWAASCSEDLSSVTCPLCTRKFQIPDEGVEGFPVDFRATCLKETVDGERQERSTIHYCEIHDDKGKEYFCETCQSALCSHCCIFDEEQLHKGHKFTKLDTAVERQREALKTLHMALTSKEQKYVEVISRIDKIKQCVEVELMSIRSVSEEASNAIEHASGCEIISMFPNLSSEIQECIDSTPDVVIPDLNLIVSQDESSDISPQSPEPSSREVNEVHQRLVDPGAIASPRRWQKCGSIATAPNASFPKSVGIHSSGDIITINYKTQVSVFSNSGVFRHGLRKSRCAFDVTVSPNGLYIVAEKGQFCMYDDDGNAVETIPTYDIHHRLSNPRSVAVDSEGRIVLGVGAKTISVHRPDGEFISKFETPACPDKLTCTPDGRIVGSFMDNTIQVMDQTGQNAMMIDAPHNIQSWKPVYVCCGKKDDLYVGNWGEPKGVFRYILSDGGEYIFLDRIAKMNNFPYGIALSQQYDKLFVVDYFKSEVVIYGTKESLYSNIK